MRESVKRIAILVVLPLFLLNKTSIDRYQ